MKKKIRVPVLMSFLLLLFQINCFAQTKWYLGGSLGVTMGKEYNVQQGKETMMPQDILFSMSFSYRYKNFIAELEPTYAGIIGVPLSVGYVVDLGKKADITFQGGIADVIYPDLEKPIQIIHDFYPMGKIRLQVLDGFLQAEYYGKTYFFHIGLRCGMFE